MNAATIIFLIISVFSHSIPAVFAKADDGPEIIMKIGSFFMIIYACVLIGCHFVK